MNVLRGKESRRRMASESGLRYDSLRYPAADSHVDLHRLADPKQRCAGIVHAPLQMSRSGPCFRQRSPCTVRSAESKVKWMVVRSASSGKELCPWWLYLRLPCMTL